MTLLERYERLVEPYNWSKLYVRWSFLACISAVLERKCWLNEEGLGYLYPNIYVLLVGPPASFKTATCDCAVRELIKPMGDGKPTMAVNQTSPSSLVAALKRSGAENTLNNYQSSPLFIYSNEFRVFSKDIGGGEVLDVLLDWFDNSRIPGENWERETRKWGLEEAANPAVTLLACTTQKDIVERRLADTAGLGFVSRVIIVCEPGNIQGTTKFPRLDANGLERLRIEFNRMVDIRGEFRMSPEAEKEKEKLLLDIQEWNANNPGTTLFASTISRKAVQVRKTAMLLSACRDNRMIVTGEDMKQARALFEQLEPTVPAAFGMEIRYRDPALMTKILDKIPNGAWVPESKILQGFYQDGQGIPYGYEYKDVLYGLMKLKKISIKKDEKTDELMYKRIDI